MKILTAILICLSMWGCASTQIVKTLPWDRAEIEGYWFSIIAKDQTESFRFKADGSAITTIYCWKDSAICAPILPWSLNKSGALTIYSEPENITLERVVRKNGKVEILRNGISVKFNIRKSRY